MGTRGDEHGRVSWTTPGDVERLIETERELESMTCPVGGPLCTRGCRQRDECEAYAASIRFSHS